MPRSDVHPHFLPPGANACGFLSYNIQTGISTGSYRHYLTKSWRQVLPHPERLDNLDRIATMIGDYDMVGLQEVDGGSLRSGFINQIEYLAHEAGFPHWHDQTNRDLGKFARYSIGLLTRFHPSALEEWRLPGRIPGARRVARAFRSRRSGPARGDHASGLGAARPPSISRLTSPNASRISATSC